MGVGVGGGGGRLEGDHRVDVGVGAGGGQDGGRVVRAQAVAREGRARGGAAPGAPQGLERRLEAVGAVRLPGPDAGAEPADVRLDVDVDGIGVEAAAQVRRGEVEPGDLLGAEAQRHRGQVDDEVQARHGGHVDQGKAPVGQPEGEGREPPAEGAPGIVAADRAGGEDRDELRVGEGLAEAPIELRGLAVEQDLGGEGVVVDAERAIAERREEQGRPGEHAAERPAHPGAAQRGEQRRVVAQGAQRDEQAVVGAGPLPGGQAGREQVCGEAVGSGGHEARVAGVRPGANHDVGRGRMRRRPDGAAGAGRVIDQR